MTARKLRVAVLFGGRSGEHDVSLMSARGVLDSIDRDRYEVVPIAITRSGRWLPPRARRPPRRYPLPRAGRRAGRRPAGTALVADPRARALLTYGAPSGPDGAPGATLLQRFDVVFPVLHGPYGEDGTVQGFLELANIPYVGAGVLGSALGMDKGKMKEVLRYHGLPVPDWVAFRRWQWSRGARGRPPRRLRFRLPLLRQAGQPGVERGHLQGPHL